MSRNRINDDRRLIAVYENQALGHLSLWEECVGTGDIHQWVYLLPLIEELIADETKMMAFKSLNYLGPKYMYNMFTKNSHFTEYNLRNTYH